MNKSKALRKYLLSRFLLTLFCVGLAQAGLNLAMKSFIMPLLERIMGINGILTGKSLAEAIGLFVSCIFLTIIRYFVGNGSLVQRIAVSEWAPGVLGQDTIESIRKINEELTNNDLGWFAFKVVIFVLILVSIWVLPYAIGAFVYSEKVSARVDELEKAEAEREKEYERQRNLLLSDITHDIKTPITTIAGFSKALADNEVPEEQRQDYLNTLYNKSMNVSNLVSLLFEYIKLDSSGYTLKKEKLNLSECLRECVAGVFAEFENKGIEIEPDIPENVIDVFADKIQLERVINNVLSNTIKYNSSGTRVGIKLWTEVTEAVFRISDSGEKIDSEAAKHIFDPFVRGDATRKSNTGNGLGLSIAKKIIELHGGRIYLIQFNSRDEFDMIKCFEIRLPLYSDNVVRIN